MANIVAITGRPNVGKSTLFNRLIGQRDAIMHNESGVTRDRHYGMAEWIGTHFSVIDTGGYVHGSQDIFESSIRQQVEIAMEEADVVLFLVDSIAGLTPLDEEFAEVLRKSNKPVMLVANKADSFEKMQNAMEFYALGFEQYYPISSADGSGTGELLDALVEKFPSAGKEPESDDTPRISVVGRPNAGKSSFVNLLMGEERSIVTDQAGTTRDAIHSLYKAYGQEFIIVDTAGLRKKTRQMDNIEFYSTMRAIRSLEDSDVCIIVIDATMGIESQDMNIIGLAERNKKGMVILINKWDLVAKDNATFNSFTKKLRERLGAGLDYVPLVFTSMLTKQRVFQAVEKAVEVYNNRNDRVPTSKLNDVILPAIERQPPPSYKGKFVKIKFAQQLPSRTPVFAFYANLPQYIKESYSRYLENRIRENFNFEGVPIQLFFRKK